MKLTAETTVFDENAVQNKFSELVVDQDGIRTEVGKKVGNNEVISRINQSAESVKIQAQRVEVDGTLIVGKSAVDTAKAEAISTASDDATAKANEARKYADNFVTYVSAADGIKVHSVNDTSNYVQINSNGTDIVMGGDSVASYGDTARIGKSDSNNVLVNTDGFNIGVGSNYPIRIATRIDGDYGGQFGCVSGNNNALVGCSYYSNTAEVFLSAHKYNSASNIIDASIALYAGGSKSGTIEFDAPNGNKFYATDNYFAGDIRAVGSIKVSNHSTAIGSTLSANLTTAKTATRNAETNLLSLSLPAGTWVIEACVTFPTGMGGIVAMGVNTSSTGTVHQAQTAGNNYGATKLCAPYVVTPTATTTYYLNVYNATSANLTIAAGSLHNGTYMYATRIA